MTHGPIGSTCCGVLIPFSIGEKTKLGWHARGSSRTCQTCLMVGPVAQRLEGRSAGLKEKTSPESKKNNGGVCFFGTWRMLLQVRASLEVVGHAFSSYV